MLPLGYYRFNSTSFLRSYSFRCYHTCVSTFYIFSLFVVLLIDMACLGGEITVMIEMRDVDTDLVQGEDRSIGQGLDLVLAQRGWLNVYFLKTVVPFLLHHYFFVNAIVCKYFTSYLFWHKHELWTTKLIRVWHE